MPAVGQLDPRAVHRMVMTVAQEDIDDLGHVNNAAYLRYVERVARAHSDRLGLTLDSFRALGVVPVVHRHVITYHRPARVGERLELSTTVVTLKGVRAQRHNEVRRAEDGVLLADALTDWVWVDVVRGRPRAVPVPVLEAFGLFEPSSTSG